MPVFGTFLIVRKVFLKRKYKNGIIRWYGIVCKEDIQKEQKEKTMEKVKNYIQLHLNILLFSLTSVFSKMASVQYNRHGLGSIWLYVFPVHSVCKQECVPVMVADLGSGDLSWKSVGAEYYRNPGSTRRRMGGAALWIECLCYWCWQAHFLLPSPWYS